MTELRARMDAETRGLLDALPGVVAGAPLAPDTPPMEAARRQARAIFLAFAGDAPPDSACEVQQLNLPSPGGPMQARLYWPTSAPRGDPPAVLFLHGGGWSVGDLDGYDPLLRALAVDAGMVVLAPEYRLAPEHPFPAALEDSVAGLDWMLARTSGLCIDRRRMSVAGDSAGGALAAVVARERAGDLAAQVLVYPMTDVSRPHAHFPSRAAFGNGDAFLTREAIEAAGA